MKIRTALIHLSVWILATTSLTIAQERFVVPIDEGPQDKSFVAFRNDLIAALKRKDKNFLTGVLDKNIAVSFGGDDGIEDFKKYWSFNQPDTKVWDELLKVVLNGGKFVNDGGDKEFCAPYSFSNFPDDIDSFEHNMIFGSNVRLRSKPDLKSKIIGKLSYNVVKIDWENSVNDGKVEPTYTWYKVETLGRMKGFVSAEYVRSPIAHRACFTKSKGKWKLTAFIAGD